MAGYVTPNNAFTIDNNLLLTDIFGNHFTVHINFNIGVAYNYPATGADFPPITHVSSGGEAVYFTSSTIPWTSVVTQAGGTDHVSGSHDTATFSPLPAGTGLSGVFTVFDNVTPAQATTLNNNGRTFYGANNAILSGSNILPAQFSVALGGLGLPGASVADQVGAHAIQEVDINITNWSLANNVLTGTYTIGAKEGTYDPSAPGNWVGFPNNTFLVPGSFQFSLNFDPTVTIATLPSPPPPLLPEISFDFTHSDQSIPEGGTANYTLSRSFVPLNDTGSSVLVTTQDGTGQAGLDYQPNTVRVVFAPGQRTAVVPNGVKTIDNAVYENNPNFHVLLTDPIGATVGLSEETTTILDNDQLGPPFPVIPFGALVIPANFAGVYNIPDGATYVANLRTQIGTVQAAAGNHSFYTGLHAVLFKGGAGIDHVFPMSGGNTFTAGTGNTIVDYSLASSATTINLANGTETGAFIGNDILQNIHNVVGTGLNDTFIGSGTADTFSGGAGNDRFTGGLGNDTIDGGAGTDTAIYSGPHSAYAVVLRPDGSVVVSGPEGTDTLTNIEQLSFSDGTITAPKFPHWMASSDIGAHPAGYAPISGRDFTGDGTSDVLWYNSTTNDIDLWKISNGKWAGSADIGAHPAGYSPAGTADFNHDGTADLIWYNPTSGDVDLWKISNGQWAGSSDIGVHPLGWQPVGSGDFNGDGTADVLWYNPTTNDAEVWMIQNGHWAGSVDIGAHPAGWRLLGSGDMDGDHTSDAIWFNPATNDIDVWKISNGHWAGSTDIGAHPAGYTPVAAGDFNGDGTGDVAWYNAASGDIELWLLQNGHWGASIDIGAHPTGWSPSNVGDFDHSGVPDILWHDPASNHVEAWLLSTS
jgi:hypothetical protein